MAKEYTKFEKDMYNWNRGCLRKKRYNTYYAAQCWARNVEKKYAYKVRIYFCPECLGYHFTRNLKGGHNDNM